MKLWLSKSVDLDKKKNFPILEKVEKKLSFSTGKKKNFLFQENWESEKALRKIVNIKVVELVDAIISEPVAPPYHFSKARLWPKYDFI